MKEYRKARILAENYVFGNKHKLTAQDLQTIKTSPFKAVLEAEEKTAFIELVEQQLQKIQEQSLPTEEVSSESSVASFIPRSNKYFSGVSRDEIIELIRCIEDEFKLEVPYNYSKIEVNKLKEFINSYTEKHIFDEETSALVLKVADKEHPEEIMGGLRVYLGR